MNYANYARGLLDRLDQAVQREEDELAAQLRKELSGIAEWAREHISSRYGLVSGRTVKLSTGRSVPNPEDADLEELSDRLDAALAAPAAKAPAKAPAKAAEE